ncbi:MAG: HAMP domain-containing histidine kinase [Bacteroidaceae bacterium]|nr:HAMP domain-containing histidine kinase [Bacteroidaceae bacterium]
MTRFTLKVLCTTVLLTLSAYALVACLLHDFYFSAFGCLLVQVFLIIYIVSMQKHLLSTMLGTIELIRMGDTSDRVSSSKGCLGRALVRELNLTFDMFRQRLQSEAIRQHYYEQVLDEVDTGVLVCREDGEITWQNRASILMLGSMRDMPQEWIATRSAHKVTHTHHNTVYEMLVCSRKFVLDRQTYRIVSLRDIHEVLEETEIEAWQKLVSVLTHEIMNSLTPIIGLSESADGMDERADSALAVIHRRSKGLLEFVNNYRKLTRIPQPQMESVPVQEYFNDLMEFYGQRLRCNATPSTLEVNADPRLLMQVLVNLVNNASEAGPGPIDINVARNANGHIEISVRDYGQGILPEVINSIFIPFFTTKPQGSGIGLSLCKQIIQRHGGRISVKSQPQHGSVFTITLP